LLVEMLKLGEEALSFSLKRPNRTLKRPKKNEQAEREKGRRDQRKAAPPPLSRLQDGHQIVRRGRESLALTAPCFGLLHHPHPRA